MFCSEISHGKNMLTMVDGLAKDFSMLKLKELIKSIVTKNSKSTKLINQLKEICIYQDVFFYSWKILSKMLEASNENGEVFMLNVLELLENISLRKNFPLPNENECGENKILGLHNGPKKFILDVSILKKYIRKTWENLVNRDFNKVICKKLLLILLESYLSDLDNPLFLTDFLMSAMNIKGAISILALQGMSTLIIKHNIEYPNIYKKLYTIFDFDIFHNKFKSRFFYLADMLLSSTHLPEIMVASFIKRASRIGLTCAASDILLILRFVGNLLLRHPGLKKMIHHPVLFEVQEDPFIVSENDPSKTHASESSLWEISLLKNHCQPSVSSAARFIDCNLPSLEFDLNEVLDKTYESMFESESKKNKSKTSMTFERPEHTVAKLKDDQVYKLWSLTKQNFA